MEQNKYKMADLFAGGGGFHLAANKVGGIEVTYACEYNKLISRAYNLNFGIDSFCDMYSLTDDYIRSLGEFDIVTAGFPCQPFSSTGSKMGFDDEKNGRAFMALLNFIKVSSPKTFVLENVDGLTRTHKFRETFSFIMKSLEGLGYCVKWKVLRSKDFGNAQFRSRVYIVGIRGSDGFEFPIGTDSSKLIEDVLFPVSSLKMEDFFTQEHFDYRNFIMRDYYHAGIIDKERTTGSFRWVWHSVQSFLPVLGTDCGNKSNGCVFQDRRILKEWDMDDYLSKGYNDKLFRKLTFMEQAAVQGYDGYNWGDFSSELKSKIIGNSITVAVGEAVIREVVKCL